MQEEKIAKIDIPNTKNGVLDLATLIFRFTDGLYHNGIRFTDCVLWNASLNLVHGRQAKLWVEVSSMTFYLNAARMS